jgi:thioredoxin reductase (NADPH)
MPPEILVIGGGASGMTAALYALRSGHRVQLVEKETFGGQIADSPRIENFPSVKAISGLDFSSALFDQITALGAQSDLDEIQSLTKTPTGFRATGRYGVYEATAVILATGAKHRRLDIPGEKRLLGHGISYCAVCDGPFYAGKDVIVIGDGNTAVQYAILLAGLCRHVEVVTLFDRFFAEEIMIKNLLSLPNVSVRPNLSAVSFEGSERLEAVVFKDTKTAIEQSFKAAACFIAIGQVPDNERFKDLVDLKDGFILTDEAMATKTPGLFAAGDCRAKKVRQLTTAASDGTIAALAAADYLSANNQS